MININEVIFQLHKDVNDFVEHLESSLCCFVSMNDNNDEICIQLCDTTHKLQIIGELNIRVLFEDNSIIKMKHKSTVSVDKYAGTVLKAIWAFITVTNL